MRDPSPQGYGVHNCGDQNAQGGPISGFLPRGAPPLLTKPFYRIPHTQGYGPHNCDDQDTHYAGDPYDIESSVLEIGTFALSCMVRGGGTSRLSFSLLVKASRSGRGWASVLGDRHVRPVLHGAGWWDALSISLDEGVKWSAPESDVLTC